MYAIEIDPIDPRWPLRVLGRPRPRLGPQLMAVARPEPVDFAEMIAAIADHADRAAFATLFGYFAPRVKGYLVRLGAAPAAAEELAQETLLTVWRRAATFDARRAGVSTWIFTIARNLRIDAARRERLGATPDDRLDPLEAEPAPDALVASVQAEARVRRALAALPAEQAEVVRLSFFSDKPHAAIAEELGLPLGTVKSRLRLALQRLRTALGDLK